jgi:vancomycin resistance protein YoaR
MAPVIIGNKFDEGMGGGICQVSSTAYKAALLAGMAVVERHNHSLTVSYIDLGLDAAVVYGMLDLKLRNDSAAHVLLKTFVHGNVLTVKIFGSVIPDRKISLASAVIEVFEPEELRVVDPELLAGVEEVTEKGARGYKVTTKRMVAEGGVAVTTEQLPSSYYRPINRVITVGEQMAGEILDNSRQDEPEE